jgi:hypothetical protein
MRYILIITALAICGCEQTTAPDSSMPGRVVKQQGGSEWVEVVDSGRFTVKTHKRINAGYGNNVRDIMVIHDAETGRDYLAVTGCGTTELHSETRRVGKVSHVEQVEE